MNARREIQTDRRLWLLFGCVAFAWLGFVRLWPEGVDIKVGPGYFWGFLLWPPHMPVWWQYPLTVGGGAAVMAVPAAVLGWAAQAVVMAIRATVYPPEAACPPN